MRYLQNEIYLSIERGKYMGKTRDSFEMWRFPIDSVNSLFQPTRDQEYNGKRYIFMVH